MDSHAQQLFHQLLFEQKYEEMGKVLTNNEMMETLFQVMVVVQHEQLKSATLVQVAHQQHRIHELLFEETELLKRRAQLFEMMAIWCQEMAEARPVLLKQDIHEQQLSQQLHFVQNFEVMARNSL